MKYYPTMKMVPPLDCIPERSVIEHVLQSFEHCVDLKERAFPENGVRLVYLGTLTDAKKLAADVILPFTELAADEASAHLQRPPYEKLNAPKEIVAKIVEGHAAIFHLGEAFAVDLFGPEHRSIQDSKTESVMSGPHEAFVETLDTNLSLLRRRIKTSSLKVMRFEVGRISKTAGYIVYLDGIANGELLGELVKRVTSVTIDGIQDTNMLIQVIDDHPHSVFPQFITTERPDVAAAKLLEGKIVGMLDGSPSAFCAPSGFFEFFQSRDDYGQRWVLATATRMMRYAALIVTLMSTALYVATSTFHYEMLPDEFLTILTKSRSQVPFPPLYEALMLEITIELLREAGARLPNKIGQTIGIVGGIVIGQAAVSAGFTSNILVITVAASAIASFVVPSYMMAGAIRTTRFSFILLAGLLGNFGIIFALTFLVSHLCGLTNLGSPYMYPVAPMNRKAWKETLIRGPYRLAGSRKPPPSSAQSEEGEKQGGQKSR
ncbi:spore germination protein [Paenibacillus sp. MBLB4367]|uniref:spore germination protein n=1 Tax=Paenibacillus sp. MBLB4367 TaxID=3384767 RepID=UPI003907EA28